MSEVTGYLQKMQQKKLPMRVVIPKPSLIFLQPNNVWQWQGVSWYHMPTCCLQCPCEEFDKERLKSFYMKQSGFCVCVGGTHPFWVTQVIEPDTRLNKLSLLGKGSYFMMKSFCLACHSIDESEEVHKNTEFLYQCCDTVPFAGGTSKPDCQPSCNLGWCRSPGILRWE